MTTRAQISLNVNNERRELAVPTDRRLIEVLREELGLTGTKNACNQGVCGACTVLVDGQTIRACLALAVSFAGRSVTTIEGLSCGDELSDVQQAFLDAGAIQCGFCMPGLIVAATEFLSERKAPSDLEIRGAISGNLCRCSGYVKVVDAIRLAAERRATSTTGAHG
jgi:aerobic carbon-monoxide dehydrogenase small subunit